MKIREFRIKIGDYEEIVTNCGDENPDVKHLIEAATNTILLIIAVPQTDETAASLGRLLFGKQKSDGSSGKRSR